MVEVVAQVVDGGEFNLESRVQVLVISLEVGVRLCVSRSGDIWGEQGYSRLLGCLLVCSFLLSELALPANSRKVILIEFAHLLGGEGVAEHPAQPRHTWSRWTRAVAEKE